MNKISQLDGKSLEVESYGERHNVKVLVSKYSVCNQSAITLFEFKQPFAKLTICHPQVFLEENEIIVKNWGENEDIAKSGYDSGLFKDTGKYVKTGFVEAPIWEVI